MVLRAIAMYKLMGSSQALKWLQGTQHDLERFLYQIDQMSTSCTSAQDAVCSPSIVSQS